MTDRNDRPDQIPMNALKAVLKRMTHGYYKLQDSGQDGDYRTRVETKPKEYFWDHMMFHVREIKKGERFTGSGDSHAVAIVCDAMLYYEALMAEDKRREAEKLETEMLTGENGVNEEE